MVKVTSIEFQRLIKKGRQVLKVEQLSDKELDAIGKAEVPKKYKYLDAELD